MKLPDWHRHISEREPDGTWEDCTWDSGLEWYRLCFDKGKPATHAEAQLLRAASGEPSTGGSNIGDLRRGIAKRYGTSMPQPLSGFGVLWGELTPGRAAVSQGGMKAFGPTNALSRWSRNYDGSHAVLVIRLDDTDRVWWCDPLAPKGTYNGEWVTKGQLERFVRAFSGQHLVADILTEPVPETDMPNLKTYTPGHTIRVKSGSNIRIAPDNNTKPKRTLAAAETWAIAGSVKGEALAGEPIYYVRWNDGWEYVNRNGVVSGPTAPLAQADVDRAVAAAVGPYEAVVAAVKTALGV